MEPVPEDLQRAGSSVPVVDSNGSTATLDSTPGSVFSSGSMASTDISEVTTSSTQISDTDQQCYFNTNYDEDDEKAFMQPVRKSRPAISVQTFTPLIGSLLMSHSSLVCESAKAAIIGILARLRNIQLPNYDPWPERHLEIGQSKTYYAQTGVHIHDMLALSAKEKKIIQDELLNAIVIGMARLDETQSPYDPEEDGDQYVEGDGAEFGEYPWGADGTRASSPELTALVDRNDALTSTGQDADVETAVADEDGSELPPLPAVVPPQVIPDDVTPRAPSPTDAPGNPDLAPGSSLTSSKRAQLYPQTEYDSPNAPPIDHRSYSEVAAYDGEAMEESAPPPEMNGTDHLEELSVEASHGRLLSMNLIAAVVECGVLAEEDVATRLFVPEVCRMRFDESYAVRREAALAMVELLKVVPQEVVMESLVCPAAL
jgi:serine/threonine-protein phosphatase 4 regulatory subunit 1